ncbi:MAG: acyltransferase [Planctomycetaceae bacterium]|nr:acyltransferase [Planctomycetales bacterium]MCB9937670.1 acyltransferase [Planctomycetaceae bacterium]
MKYRAELDGLRAFAVIPVILFHMGFDWLGGGYIGVDVFFVISGFLIASILIREIGTDTFSMREFWARRVRRILPAMLVVTAATLLVAYLFVFKGDHRPIGRQAMSALVSVANVYFWKNTGDYWGSEAESSPFLHTWSLSVEEQFYLFFPVVVWLVVRFRPRWLKSLMLLTIFSSLCLFLYGVSHYPDATFYLLPTRAWELATGCYLAAILREQSVEDSRIKSLAPLALVGLAMIVASYFLMARLNGGLVIAVLGTAFVIAFGRSGICNAILVQRPIVQVGKMSYSLYLWHWPVMVFAEYFEFASHKLMLLAPIGILSLASYYLIEKPTRRKPGIVPIIGACYLATLGGAFALMLLPGEYDTSDFNPSTWHGAYYDLKPREVEGEFTRIAAGVTLAPREASPDAYRNGGIIVGDGDGPPRLVVLGDSHGVMWSQTIRIIAERLGIKASFISINGVSPFVELPLSERQQVRFLSAEEKFQYDKTRLEFLHAWKPQVVIICTRWSEQNAEAPEDLLSFLQENVGRVLLMEQPPELAIGDRNAQQDLCFKGLKPELGTQRLYPLGNDTACQAGRTLVRTLADRYPNCGYIPIYDLYLQSSQAIVLDGRDVVYLDDDHLTDYGTQLSAKRIEREIATALEATSTASPMR